jgi:hypothetical protein
MIYPVRCVHLAAAALPGGGDRAHAIQLIDLALSG